MIYCFKNRISKQSRTQGTTIKSNVFFNIKNSSISGWLHRFKRMLKQILITDRGCLNTEMNLKRSLANSSLSLRVGSMCLVKGMSNRKLRNSILIQSSIIRIKLEDAEVDNQYIKSRERKKDTQVKMRSTRTNLIVHLNQVEKTLKNKIQTKDSKVIMTTQNQKRSK